MTNPKFELAIKGRSTISDFKSVTVRLVVDHAPLWTGTLDELCEAALECLKEQRRFDAARKAVRACDESVLVIDSVTAGCRKGAAAQRAKRLANRKRDAYGPITHDEASPAPKIAASGRDGT